MTLWECYIANHTVIMVISTPTMSFITPFNCVLNKQIINNNIWCILNSWNNTQIQSKHNRLAIVWGHIIGKLSVQTTCTLLIGISGISIGNQYPCEEIINFYIYS